MSASAAGIGGGAAVKGLRLVTMIKGKEGFGFHMHTNKERDGQHVKNVTPNSPADLSGVLAGDHILAVDGHSVVKETHHQVVERVRRGDGEKKMLVIDIETEDEMRERGEEINPDDAIVMIPRDPPPPLPPVQESEKGDFILRRLVDVKKHKKKIKPEMSWEESVKVFNKLS